MVILHLFIEHHYKSIVSIIRERHVLTLHLSTANWRIKLTTGYCCKNVASCYAIYFCLVESIPQFPELWPISMHVHGTSNYTLLYRNATTYGIIWVTNSLVTVHLSPVWVLAQCCILTLAFSLRVTIPASTLSWLSVPWHWPTKICICPSLSLMLPLNIGLPKTPAVLIP